MDETFGIGNSSLAAIFLHINTGSEQFVVKDLKDLGYTKVYKTLGQYDVLTLFDITSFDDGRFYTSCRGVRAAKSLTAYQVNTHSYSTQDVAFWAGGSPLLGFVFLELDKWLYSPESGASSSINAIRIITEKLNELSSREGLCISLYGGFGAAELYAIVKTDNIEDVWKFTAACRNLTIKDCFTGSIEVDEFLPVFTRTQTIPCISFDDIKYGEGSSVELTSIKGKTSASIAINIQPGFEKYIVDEFVKEDGFQFSGALGNDDVVINTTRPIEISFLISKLLAFRRYWELKHGSHISTCTTLLETVPSTDAGVAKTYSIQATEHTLVVPASLKGSNPRLANRIQNFSHNLDAVYHNTPHRIAVRGIRNFINYYVKLLLERYEEEGGSAPERKYVQESKLLEAIESAEIGLYQRVENNFETINYNYDTPPPLGDGIFSSLIAIESLIDHIFTEWSSCHEDYEGTAEGNGFPTFNDSYGFRMGWGETFNLPLTALYNPCDSRGNWLTLTHEISHSIYIRLPFDKNERTNLGEIRCENFKVRSKYLKYDDVFDDQIFEFFAHWYDYYHFYNCEMTQYIKNVWSSWLLVPVVHQNFTEYFFRSFFIYCSSHYEEISLKMREGTDIYAPYMLKLWEDHMLLLNNIVSNLPKEKMDRINETEMAGGLIELFHNYSSVLPVFMKYINEEFRQKINSNYDDLDDQVASILEGKIVKEKIKNPYLLVKNVISKRLNSGDMRTSTALIMSLKNTNSFFKQANVNDE